MLGKLFKYEFKALSRMMMPFMLVFIAFSVVFNFFMTTGFDFNSIDNNEAAGFLLSIIAFMVPAYFIIFFVMLVLSFINCAVRYNKTMFSDEGYLMRTLPVRAWAHIFSRLAVGFIWFLICCISAVLIYATTLYTGDSTNLGVRFAQAMIVVFGDSLYEVAYRFFSLLVVYVYTQLMLIAAITGASRMKGSKTAWTVAIILALNIIVSFIMGSVSGFLDVDYVTFTVLNGISDSYTIAYYAVRIIFSIVFFAYSSHAIDGNIDIA